MNESLWQWMGQRNPPVFQWWVSTIKGGAECCQQFMAIKEVHIGHLWVLPFPALFPLPKRFFNCCAWWLWCIVCTLSDAPSRFQTLHPARVSNRVCNSSQRRDTWRSHGVIFWSPEGRRLWNFTMLAWSAVSSTNWSTNLFILSMATGAWSVWVRVWLVASHLWKKNSPLAFSTLWCTAVWKSGSDGWSHLSSCGNLWYFDSRIRHDSGNTTAVGRIQVFRLLFLILILFLQNISGLWRMMLCLRSDNHSSITHVSWLTISIVALILHYNYNEALKIKIMKKTELYQWYIPPEISIVTGWWFQPLWKIWKSVGMIIPNNYMEK